MMTFPDTRRMVSRARERKWRDEPSISASKPLWAKPDHRLPASVMNLLREESAGFKLIRFKLMGGKENTYDASAVSCRSPSASGVDKTDDTPLKRHVRFSGG